MTGREFARKWLTSPPLTGRRAFLCGLVLLAVPTLIRQSMAGMVSGFGFTPYTPFVLLASLLLRWRASALFAVCACLIGDLLFIGQSFRIFETWEDLFGSAVFLTSSAMIIALGHAIKSVVTDPLWLKGPDTTPAGVVFSLERGQALVSWYGERSFVHLGPEDEVAEMMEDFLDQRAIAKRLASRPTIVEADRATRQ